MIITFEGVLATWSALNKYGHSNLLIRANLKQALNEISAHAYLVFHDNVSHGSDE